MVISPLKSGVRLPTYKPQGARSGKSPQLWSAPSPVAREGKRNRAPAGPYQPVYAAQQARARRWRGARLERNETLRTRVLAPLHQGWSPEQVAGRLALEAGRGVLSHESISRFLDRQFARPKD